MRCWTLGSGSRGNALLFESGDTRVLVDCGYGTRTIAGRLAQVRVAPESISAVIVTHEHIDHAKGIPAAQRKWGWRLYGSRGTLAAMPERVRTLSTPVEAGAREAIGALDVELVPVPHDAVQPTAVVLTARCSGFRAGVAHDLGAVPETLRNAFARLDLLCLESNHDEQMLRTGPYPAFLQERVAGRNGHLSNRQSMEFVRELASRQLLGLVLLHLSETNNTPVHATAAAATALRSTRCGIRPSPAPQDQVAGPFGSPHDMQMALAL